MCFRLESHFLCAQWCKPAGGDIGNMGCMSENTYIVEYSRPENERAGTHLVLLLHGYGSHEKDLLSLAEHLPQEGITYAGMRAPQPVGTQFSADATGAHIPDEAIGYQWYPLDQQLNADVRTIEQASDYVLEWVEQHKSHYASVALVGFSQGMAVATSMVRHRPGKFAALVGLSGYAVESDSPYFKDDELKATELPVFFGRDQEDPIIPQPFVDYTYEWIRAYTDGIKVLYAGAGHGVSALEIRHVGEFIDVKVLGHAPRIRDEKVADAADNAGVSEQESAD